MQVTEIGVSKTIKIPVPGIQYSNQEASCHMTASLEKGEDASQAMKDLWKEVNEQVTNGLEGGVQSALA